MRFAIPDDKNGPVSARPAVDPAHHGARDGRQAARARSERDHARHGGGGKVRSYTFRRS